MRLIFSLEEKNSLKRELQEIVSNRLILFNKHYLELFNVNIILLANDNLKFKVVSDGSSPFDSSTTALAGKKTLTLYQSEFTLNRNKFIGKVICK